MQLFLLALMLLVSVLASNVISKFIPAVATPLVQICLGLALAWIVPVPGDFQLPTSLFMAVFVAPLIYSDSRGIDRVAAWRNRGPILQLAIGLVVATTLVVGGAMGLLIPAISLAAAFVLGAAVSPTDTVAVAALAESSEISRRQRAILSTESIVNDATGVVAYNVAVSALMSGSFSLVQAGTSFLWLFLGGIALGVAAGIAVNLFSSFVTRIGCDDVVFHVLLDLMVPFITFMAGEVAGVSPVMAVMACALLYKIGTGKIGPHESRMSIVSGSVWNVLSFTLNGIIFVMLGYQLEAAMSDMTDAGVSAPLAAGAGALLVAVVFGLRFLFIALMELGSRRRGRRAEAEHGIEQTETVAVPAPFARNVAVLTFAGGTKGAVTLSIAMSIPYAVRERSLVIFLVSVLIITSLVAANAIVPLIAPSEKTGRDERQEAERRAKVDILRRVIERLSAESTDANAMATQLVIADYNERIATLRSGLPETELPVSRRAVRAAALRLEASCVNDLMEAGEVTEACGYRYLSRLNELMRALDRRSRIHWLLARNLRRARGTVRSLAGITRERLRELVGAGEDSAETVDMRGLQLRCSRYVVERLQGEVQNDRFPVEDVTAVLLDYRRAVERLETASPSLTVIAQRGVQKETIQLRGVTMELEGIQDAQDEGLISREAARRMRDGAYLMRLDLENLV